jgi:hypothetical protein
MDSGDAAMVSRFDISGDHLLYGLVPKGRELREMAV